MVEAAGGRRARCHRASSGRKPPGSITIEQLLALNEEIRALVRAGVPLERGLLGGRAEPARRAGPDHTRAGDPA